MSSLPEWMLLQKRSDGLDAGAPPWSAARAGTSLARRALAGFARLAATTLADDAIAARGGLLQGIDPRIKAVSLLGLVVVATLIHSLPALLACYAACIALAAVSRVGARRFAGVWLVVPLFSAAIMLPATLNVVTDGNPVWTIVHFTRDRFGPWRLPSALAVTDAGLLAAARMVLRTAVCVSLALLLTVTTPRARLLRGLRGLGVPALFVTMLAMMDRYLGILVRAAEEVHLAKVSRSVAPMDLRREQAWAAAGIASVFRRSSALGQEVYLAMLSRGYSGEIRLFDDPPVRGRDWLFLAGAAAFAAILLVMG